MFVLVASHTCLEHREERSVQVFDLDCGALGCRNFVRRVAAIAGQSSVLALEDVTGLLVIEGLSIPLDQWKIFAVVVGVTTRAVLA